MRQYETGAGAVSHMHSRWTPFSACVCSTPVLMFPYLMDAKQVRVGCFFSAHTLISTVKDLVANCPGNWMSGKGLLTEDAQLLDVLAQSEQRLWAQGVLSDGLQVQRLQLRHVLHCVYDCRTGLLEQDPVPHHAYITNEAIDWPLGPSVPAQMLTLAHDALELTERPPSFSSLTLPRQGCYHQAVPHTADQDFEQLKLDALPHEASVTPCGLLVCPMKKGRLHLSLASLVMHWSTS